MKADQQLKRPETSNGTRSEDEHGSSPADDDFERESTAKVSPSLPPSSLASILGPSSSRYLEDLEEDTLSPRMRDVALDAPLLIVARVSKTESPSPACLSMTMHAYVRNRSLPCERNRPATYIFISTFYRELRECPVVSSASFFPTVSNSISGLLRSWKESRSGSLA